MKLHQEGVRFDIAYMLKPEWHLLNGVNTPQETIQLHQMNLYPQWQNPSQNQATSTSIN